MVYLNKRKILTLRVGRYTNVHIKALVYNIHVMKYFRKNPTSGYVLKNGDAASLSGSNFDKSKATKIITHGWNNNGNSDVNMNIRDGKA